MLQIICFFSHLISASTTYIPHSMAECYTSELLAAMDRLWFHYIVLSSEPIHVERTELSSMSTALKSASSSSFDSSHGEGESASMNSSTASISKVLHPTSYVLIYSSICFLAVFRKHAYLLEKNGKNRSIFQKTIFGEKVTNLNFFAR